MCPFHAQTTPKTLKNKIERSWRVLRLICGCFWPLESRRAVGSRPKQTSCVEYVMKYVEKPSLFLQRKEGLSIGPCSIWVPAAIVVPEPGYGFGRRRIVSL